MLISTTLPQLSVCMVASSLCSVHRTLHCHDHIAHNIQHYMATVSLSHISGIMSLPLGRTLRGRSTVYTSGHITVLPAPASRLPQGPLRVESSADPTHRRNGRSSDCSRECRWPSPPHVLTTGTVCSSRAAHMPAGNPLRS